MARCRWLGAKPENRARTSLSEKSKPAPLTPKGAAPGSHGRAWREGGMTTVPFSVAGEPGFDGAGAGDGVEGFAGRREVPTAMQLTVQSRCSMFMSADPEC